MVRDLSDPHSALRESQRNVRRLMASTAIQNTAVDRGALRVKSAEGLEVGTAEDPTGSQFVYGILRIIGQLIGDGSITWSGPWRFTGNGAITGDVVAEGKWTQNGPWEFNGDGDIAGDVDVTGNLEVLGGGRIKVGNVIITPGSGGKITVGVGSAQVVIDGATGKITAGDLTIDPTRGGGAVVFDNGAEIYSHASNGQIELVSGNGANVVTIRDDKIQFIAPEITSSRPTAATEGDLEYLRWMAWDSRDGSWKSVDPGMGGPMGGPLEFPFSLTLVTSEFGMRDHPDGTGPRMHEGMDFAPPAGTPIPAAGSGVVASSGYSSGYGNEVWIDHGMIRGQRVRTHYAHMQAPGVAAGTALGKGAIVGLVGNTGESFGAHLHFEVEVDGVKVNPRDYISD